MRHKYIREHRQEFSIKRMRQIRGVTRSGYYAWQPEKTGVREWENNVWWNKSVRNTKPVARPTAVRAYRQACCARE
jgi:hypothetical protein